MRRATIDRDKLRQQIELVDILADTSTEYEQELLDGLGDFLDKILISEIQCFLKENNNGTIE